MRKYPHRCQYKYKKIIGITIGLIGCIIIISVMPMEILLSLIGLSLLIMAYLLLKIK